MSDPIFVKTRYHYDPYVDFWDLVALSKFQSVYVDEMDLYDSEKLYVVSPHNGELEDFMKDKKDGKKANVYLWNLERPGGSGGVDNYKRDGNKLVEDGYVDKIIVSDVALATECGKNFMYVPLGSHEHFGYPGQSVFVDKEYDLIHLSCYSNNRSWMFNTPENSKLDLCGLSVAGNGWGQERHERLMRSKFMLCTHQDEYPFIEPIRYAMAAAYGLPIIGEASLSTAPYNNVFQFEKQFDFCRVARAVVERYSQFASIGLEYREKMTGELSFRRCIERYI